MKFTETKLKGAVTREWKKRGIAESLVTSESSDDSEEELENS